MSRVLVVSSHPPSWQKLADVTTATHRKWCERHGYDYFLDRSDTSWPARSPEWGAEVKGYIPIRGFVKLDLLLHFMDPESCRKEYDVVAWLDADLVVTNYDKPMPMPNGDRMIMCYDANGHNSTVMIAANCWRVYDLIWAANNAGRTMFIRHDWAEMESLLRFSLAPPYTDTIEYRSVKELCAMPPDQYPVPKRVTQKYEWERGDFACHLSAMKVERRTEIATKLVEELGLL